MFKDAYSKDNEQIVIDEATRKYIKSKLIEEDRKSKTKINYNAIIATALSLVLAVGVTFIAKNPVPQNNYIGDTALLENMTYDGIFDSINSRIKNNENFFSYITDGISFLTGNFAKDDSMDMVVPESAPSDIGTTGTGDPGESSTTNNQVQGVDEADLVKNDGKYIYSVKDGNLIITDSNNGSPKIVTKKGFTDRGETVCGFFVNQNRLMILLDNYRYGDTYVRILVLDITDKENVNVVSDKKQDGYYANSRMIEDTVYILSNHTVRNNIAKSKPETFVPCIDDTAISAEDICVIEDFESPSYLVISSLDLASGEVIDNTAVLGGAENVYCNAEHLYYTFTKYGKFDAEDKIEHKTETTIVKLSLSGRKIKTEATGKVEGRPLNQFSMDEYDGNLRIVTTVDKTVIPKKTSSNSYTYDMAVVGSSKNALYVLDKNLQHLGSIENLAEGERVYSVRFDGEIGYFVTFRQVDPLFTVDLSDPKEPKILSELKIPGFSEYLHPFGEGELFGFGKNATEEGSVTGLKISMFDVSDPTNVTENHVTPIDAAWSEASENHKAIMVDANKNLIVFLATDNFSKTNLYVYGYDSDKGFYEKTVSYVDDSYNFGTRFVWINDHFYLVSQKGITTFSLNTFEKLNFLAY